MTTILRRIIGLAIGIVLVWYGQKKQRYKFLWLGYFLLGKGGRRYIPYHIASQWDCNWNQPIDSTHRYIRPYGSELFWMVGAMTVTVCGRIVYGEDVYDFHMQNGQNVIHGNDKTLQWAFSGGEKDETHIPPKYHRIILSGAKVLRLTECFKIDSDYLLVSNDLWNQLGGVPFISVLRVTQ